MMNPQLKIKPYRSEKYLNFIRSKPCVICGKQDHSGSVNYRRIKKA